MRLKYVWPQSLLVAPQVMKLPEATPVMKVRMRPDLLEVMAFTQAVASSEKPLICGKKGNQIAFGMIQTRAARLIVKEKCDLYSCLEHYHL